MVRVGVFAAYFINAIVLLLVLGLITALVMWAFTTVRNGGTRKLLLQKLTDDSYIRIDLDRVEKVDIVDKVESVIHMEDDQKIIVKTDDARRVIRRLK